MICMKPDTPLVARGKLCISLLGLICPLPILAAGITVPIGTQLEVRLTTEASSEKPSGQPVSAVLIAPLFVNGVQAIPAGTRFSGNTADAHAFRPAGDQAAEQPATLRVQFTHIQDSAGHSKPIYCVLHSVDNARETTDSSGLITGITTSETYESQINRGLNKLQGRYGGFAQILSGVKGALLKDVDTSIDFKPGVEMTLELTRPLIWDDSGSAAAVAGISDSDGLAALVAAEPFRTVAQNPPKPSDMTNLMFIGTADQIRTAFQDAGWFPAEALSRSSKMETARAIIEDRGYNEAPMSILMLDGRPPDLALQKQTDTFAMRHHIRIWQRPDTFHGKPVWVAAATHDTGISFSAAGKSFTHAIDPHIDLERSKVVNDLLFTNRVHAIALVDRTGIPQDASNATGDKLITDGKMAVLEF